MPLRLPRSVLLAFLVAAPLAAQQPTTPPADSAAPPRGEARPMPTSVEGRALDAPGLLALARRARLAQDEALQSYDARARERFTAALGLRDVARERTVWRQESASRVRWSRATGVHLDLVGRRNFAAGFAPPPEQGGPDGFTGVPWYPGRDALWIGGSRFVRADVDEKELVHPLANGAEKFYAYTRGDSLRLRLGDGSTITLVELRVAPRSPQWKLAVGSFWLDDRSGQLVRAAFRYSAPIDIWQEARADSNPAERPPRWVSWLVSPLRGEITGVTIEHGLYEGRFWLPRRQVAEGRIQSMSARILIRVEQRYDYDHVNGSFEAPPRFATERMAVRAHVDSIEAADSVRRVALADTLRRVRSRRDSAALRTAYDDWRDSSYKRWRGRADSTRKAECAATGSYTRTGSRYGDRLPIQVVVPCDEAKLAASPVFTTEILAEDDRTWGGSERAQLAASLDLGRQPVWAPQRPTLHGLTTEFLRYNRIEGLSVGGAVRQQLGAGWDWEAAARIGIADVEPNAELAVRRASGRSALRAAAYRRLVQSDDYGAAFTFGASLQNLVSALDEQFYHRAGGVELQGTRESFARGGVTWRLFAEHQWAARQGTDWAIGRLWNGDTRFSNNIVDTIATRAGTIGGVATRWRSVAGDDATPWRVSGDVRLEAAAGSFAYGRGALDLTLERRLPGRLRLLGSGSIGSSVGDMPPQRWWAVGGWQTVRGMTAGSQRGDAFWLGRGELWWQRKGFFQPAGFFDVGWAGARGSMFDGARPIRSAGGGLAFFNGLFRFDAARGLGAGGRWRFEGYAVARFQ
jgi:hypothetical protein